MARVTRVAQVGGVSYALTIHLDRSLDNDSDLESLEEAFCDSLVRARQELRSGLMRGGLTLTAANDHPMHYVDEVRAFLGQSGWGKTIQGAGLVGQQRWSTLMHWVPDQTRFQYWFQQPWAALDSDNQEWFRHTVLATLLGLLTNAHPEFELSTGGHDVFGFVYRRLPTRTFFDVHRLNMQMQTLSWNGTPSHFGPTIDLRLLRRAIDYWPHPTALQHLSLKLIEQSALSPRMHLKRASKVERWMNARGRTQWEAQCRHTLLHEASHRYAGTRDYFYFDRFTNTGGFYSNVPSSCQENLKAVFGVPVSGAQTPGARVPLFLFPQSRVGGLHTPSPWEASERVLPLANADSVAAYLDGWTDHSQFP
jgi:hypothetical protein